MNPSEDLIHQLLPSRQGADQASDLTLLAAGIRILKDPEFLHGGRELPLPALIARVLLSLGGRAEDLASQVVVVLGVREIEPMKVQWSALSEAGLKAISACDAMIDSDQFFVEEGGHLVAHRLLPVRCSKPEQFASAWRVADSSWGRHGAAKINWKLDMDAEGPVPVMQYGLEPLAMWRAPHFTPVLSGPCELGCESVLLQVLLLASGSPHPLYASLVQNGLIKEGQVALSLVALPDLAPLSKHTAGPAANNVLGSEFDGPFSGSQSPYSAWSSIAAKQLVDEWGLENGSTSELETLEGCTGMVAESLGGILEGGLVGEGSAERSYGLSLAEWVGSIFSTDPKAGAGLVREISSRRAKGEAISLELWTANNITGLAVVEREPDGSVSREHRLF